MASIDGLFGPQFDHLQTSLGLASKRQGMLLENMANGNVPGYQRKDMDFSLQLDAKLGRLSHRGGSGDGGAVRADGSNFDPEKEVVAIAETESRYETLSELTSRSFTLLKNAIREGR